ncbi:TauD/TfdA family dioxygenase [Nocardia camponoti]|uniref:TauD/TfdA-like domain-containing protein n=1 Tax=Nocardia camponoti TaxID=1616106 RepID=A0A917QG14_9NOCA|nr:TauD/TfdA family dioxygenase [Nocardia camponoti]GGK48772.1 hypothetical protein GCM10011591_20190 [Nocardia camponoti]
MESVVVEPDSRRLSELERRAIPATDAARLRVAAKEICSLSRDGSHIDLLDAYVRELSADLRDVVRVPMTASGAVVVDGFPCDAQEFAPTPASWQAAQTGDPAARVVDVMLLILARCVGEPFGWHGQQAGRLVNNIVPAAGHEDEQSGASSSVLLAPHTEDAFHPARANLLLLACLRNPDRVATTISSVREVELGDDFDILHKPVVPILPDISYGAGDFSRPPPCPTLWTDESGCLTLRYDPAYTPLDDAQPDFLRAYSRLGDELARVRRAPALKPGQVLLLDNDVAVHGRVPFRARYDGTDRWLKRVNIRLPERRRRGAEANENGYGQRVVAPFRSSTDGRPDWGNADERGHEQP